MPDIYKKVPATDVCAGCAFNLGPDDIQCYRPDDLGDCIEEVDGNISECIYVVDSE